MTSLGVRKTLTPHHRALAADTFGVEVAYMPAAQELIDTAHPEFKRVAGVKHQALQYWRGLSVPFPKPGLRLIRREKIQGCSVRMITGSAQLP